MREWELRAILREIAADPDLCRVTADLWTQLSSGTLDDDERRRTVSVLSDMLWTLRRPGRVRPDPRSPDA